MRQIVLLLTFMAVVCGLPAAGQQPTIKRLDGSAITRRKSMER